MSRLPSDDHVSSPFATLGLLPSATAEEVRAKWRELAGKHHPDRGGDAAEFHKYRLAYHAALKTAEAPKVCLKCAGGGKVVISRGLSSLVVVCPDCNGVGEKG